MGALETKPEPTLDTTLLELLLETGMEARENPDKYTSASHAAFAEYYDKAKGILDNAESQEEIDTAVSTLHQYWLNLCLLADEELISSLMDTLSVLEELEPRALKLGMAEPFRLLVTDAKAWLEADEKEQTTGLNLLTAMEGMIEDLEKPAEDKPEPEKPDTKPEVKPDPEEGTKPEIKEPVVVPETEKAAEKKTNSTTKSVKTAASLQADLLLGLAAAGLAGLGLLKARKNRK